MVIISIFILHRVFSRNKVDMILSDPSSPLAVPIPPALGSQAAFFVSLEIHLKLELLAHLSCPLLSRICICALQILDYLLQ
jgi:hypothetical protein